ncbi:MAG TPA: hypothetical protein VNF74_01515 [Terriglobales bacterium]|nr:hypothetical protein [Terriglobales bacterium]
MGNKNAPKREKKKPPQKKAAKAASGRAREDFSQAAARIEREATERA